ncbi:MAG: 4-alpha-glucanotransferase [Bacteroidetes bacterium HGW-Bacteroidetes-1]|jgi:4-alpha-glucanotransferase|nr:MAG: 4-alpha-glucanotransferase [Bacteroidetes bacterium HGW-Bacteroidetes-1]
MKILFNVLYKSNWGQVVYVVGSDELLGNWNPHTALEMNYMGNNEWSVEMEAHEASIYEYKYIVQEANGFLIWEGGPNRSILTSDYKKILIRDIFHAVVDPERVLLSKVFTEVIMKPSNIFDQKIPCETNQTIRITITAPRVGVGFGMAIVGGASSLGAWENPILMSNRNFPKWEIELDSRDFNYPVSYKYAIVNLADSKIATWEEGENRKLSAIVPNESDQVVVVNDEHFKYPVGNWKGAGVAIPVFSLRTEESFGVGEFNDIKKLVDWCAKTGLRMIQVLPINETVATHSWLDSYPYKSITVMALHPMYLHLPAMGELKDKKLMKEFYQMGLTLNDKPHVDYVGVTKTKARYFKLIFDQNWKEVSRQKDYKNFFEENRDWLLPYAAFCYLRDQYKTSDFRQWGDYATYVPDQINALTDPSQPFHEHIAVHYFQQYHLDKQLREVVEYAHSKGIALKGDIPIGISPNSIEAWTEPQLFNLNGQAGAPPDDFAMMGQNWGFPTYNWDVMAGDDFAWWKKRLFMMEKYFDAYRIDHILGFFRIWEIPKDSLHGLLGYFKPGLPMTTTEIEDSGLYFDYDRLVKPYIRQHFLSDFFGKYTEEVRRKYLNEVDYEQYELKSEFDTQRKIYDYFSPLGVTKEVSDKEIVIRDGLMSLINEVLFVKDPYAKNPSYHPRIAFHFTYSYRELEDYKKEILNDLYVQYFYKRHEEFWKQHALAKLPAIVGASKMLVCGEDLGMVPDNVPEVMRLLNILSLEIQRMPKNPRVEFGHPADAPYLSVCTTSTHDMSTIRGWWEEDRTKTQRFYNHILGHNDQTPYFAEPWICQEVIHQHLHSPAMWTIFPLQDLIAMDGNLRWDQTDKERINVPSDPENKWQYRMILFLEELLEAEDFNTLIKGMLHIAGRDSVY